MSLIFKWCFFILIQTVVLSDDADGSSSLFSLPIKQVTVATQTGHESPDLSYNPDKMTTDKHCYECKVRYRDPKPQDLVMYLHAWKYRVSCFLKFNSFFTFFTVCV